jgi:polysaccharide export outer membrane protein
LHSVKRPRSLARDAACVVLVVSLLWPSAAVAQGPPGPTEPRAPAIPAAPGLPATPFPADTPVRAPGGAAMGRPDPCTPGAGRVPSPDYLVGPGDMLEVSIVGRLEVARHQVVVDHDGMATVSPMGAVEVGALTLKEAGRLLNQRARSFLRFAEVTVSVLIPRCFEVVMSGEVERPGSIQATAMRRVHEVLLVAGGVTPRGSLRRVVVDRGGVETAVDLLRFELLGDLAQNPAVAEGMRIHVPPRGPTVVLAGAFRRPGEYELGPAGGLRELFELTGGLAQNAAPTEGRLTRVGPDGRKETQSIDLAAALAAPDDVPLRAGDELFAPRNVVLQDVIELRGAFNGTPESSRTTTAGKTTIVQRVELAQGDRIKDVVGRAGGPAAYADLRLSFVERVGPAGPRQRIPLDLHRLLVEKDDTYNIVLENGDVFTLPVVEDKVYVLGEVRTPGALDFRPELTPREYLALAGGPTVRARFHKALITFPSGQSYHLAQAPPLEPGAVLTVPEVSVRWYQDYVTISSIVLGLISSYTGFYFLLKDLREGNTGDGD